MHKWKFNNPSLREICATEEAATTKVLWLHWNTTTYSMSTNLWHVVESKHILPQRGIQKTAASIFDAL